MECLRAATAWGDSSPERWSAANHCRSWKIWRLLPSSSQRAADRGRFAWLSVYSQVKPHFYVTGQKINSREGKKKKPLRTWAMAASRWMPHTASSSWHCSWLWSSWMSNDPKEKKTEKRDGRSTQKFSTAFYVGPSIIILDRSAYFPPGALENNRKSCGDAALATLLSELDFFLIKSAIKNDNDTLLSVCHMFSLSCIVANNSYNNTSNALHIQLSGWRFFLQRIKS